MWGGGKVADTEKNSRPLTDFYKERVYERTGSSSEVRYRTG